MSTERFQQLYDTLCADIGMSCPALTPGRNAELAFHATLRGYTAAFVHAPPASMNDAFLLFDMGALPAAAGPGVCRKLMQTNFAMFGNASPVLGLSNDDHLMLHMVLPLDQIRGPALHEYLLALADWAEQWHASGWQDDGGPDLPQPGQEPLWARQFA